MEEKYKTVKKYIGLALYTPILVFYYYISKTYDTIYSNSSSTSEEFLNLKYFGGFYFTGWNFSGQVYFLVVAVADELTILTGLSTLTNKIITTVRHYLFTAIVFPSTVLVGVLYWSLYVMDRELVFPQSLDEFYPAWITHSVHSFVVVPLIIEINLPKEQDYDIVEFQKALPILTAFVVCYQTALIAVYFLHDVWLYPLFKFISWFQRILLLEMLYCMTVMFLYVGIYLQHLKRRLTDTKFSY
jgi:hypothetical protein